MVNLTEQMLDRLIEHEEPPKPPAPMPVIPSLKKVHWWMAIWGAMTLWCFGGFVSSIFSDPGDVFPALGGAVFFGVLFLSAYCHREQIVKERQQWRYQRRVDWVLNRDLPAPEEVDWAATEQILDRQIGLVRPPRRP